MHVRQDKETFGFLSPYVQDDVAVTIVELSLLGLGDGDDLEVLNAPDPETSLRANTGGLAPGLLQGAFLLAMVLLELTAKLGQVCLLKFYWSVGNGGVRNETRGVRKSAEEGTQSFRLLTPGRVLEHCDDECFCVCMGEMESVR